MLKVEEKIRNKSARIGIVGLGYVGLPLAVAFSAAGFKVLGVAIQQKRVDAVNRGQSYIADVSAEHLQTVIASNCLKATRSQDSLREADAICICVPTPLTKTKDPDLSHVIYESEEVSKYLQPEQLVVLESTTYPGTTRQIVLPILESSKLKCGVDFYLAYSPERVDPGNTKHNVRNVPKIVGGIDSESTMLAQLLYSQVADTVVPVSCPEVAEMTKIFENVFRSVNIALVNELAQLCSNMGVSVWEVIGSRFLQPNLNQSQQISHNLNQIPKYRKFGIDIITWLYNFGSKSKISDSQSCFRAHSRKLLDTIDITENGFGFSVQVLIQARRKNFVIREVPVSCIYHLQGSSLNPVAHGLGVACGVVKLRLRNELLATKRRNKDELEE